MQKCQGGKYTLRIANAPVGGVSGALFAFLHPLHTPEEWVITHLQGDLYTYVPSQSVSLVTNLARHTASRQPNARHRGRCPRMLVLMHRPVDVFCLRRSGLDSLSRFRSQRNALPPQYLGLECFQSLKRIDSSCHYEILVSIYGIIAQFLYHRSKGITNITRPV